MIKSALQKGFTLPELLITIGIISVLFGFITVNLIRTQRQSYLTTTVDTLVSDLYSQQNKAMVGDTEGSGVISDHGIYFETNRYVLFRGSSYNPSDTSNFPVNLVQLLTFSNITFPTCPTCYVLFSKGSGETGLVNGSNTVTLTDTTNGEQKIIQLNKYGAVTVQ
ncbi:MAG: hypothetical protein A3D74_03040 [Candidatus Levybacteria bacterium RIFCSPHIGHO2_02_FULL_37_13]|nr:MAG: hypothetical protein A3D74_03040 [Candidatus Levybacteria bacterium RIFCSPHIGHO2_02_FULL_37_13]OGH30621.1 MAG: hypothetical protein A3E40_00220 [Candidatus Levybacteria bacterium RIFCSPHIGHO2_12_FULL_37_9]OGH39689.1 MAG: hypothetical protein A3B41_00495 [Candidatus Levybacteria bacterium RIFCSPLOWO2_01_FULL_37_26]